MDWTGMDKSMVIQRILQRWEETEARWKTPPTTRQLAVLAAEVVTEPPMWSAGDRIPASVNKVEDSGGFTWERRRDANGVPTEQWTLVSSPDLFEQDLLGSFGPVFSSRDSGPSPQAVDASHWPTVGETCPECRIRALVPGPDRRTVRCPQCDKLFMDRARAGDLPPAPDEVTEAVIYCGAVAPWGMKCINPDGHEDAGQSLHVDTEGGTWATDPAKQYLEVLQIAEQVLTNTMAALKDVMQARQDRKTITAPLYRKVRDAAEQSAAAAATLSALTQEASTGE